MAIGIRTEKSIKKVIDAIDAGRDVRFSRDHKTFVATDAASGEVITRHTLKSLISKRLSKRKKKAAR